MLLLWIRFASYGSCLFLLCYLVCSLQPCGHCWERTGLGSLVCFVFLCFVTFQCVSNGEIGTDKHVLSPPIFLLTLPSWCFFCVSFLSPRFFNKAKGILLSPPSVRPSVHPSVRPLFYLLLNHWTKFNQIRCVSYSHESGVQRKFCLAPPPGPLGGVKR